MAKHAEGKAYRVKLSRKKATDRLPIWLHDMRSADTLRMVATDLRRGISTVAAIVCHLLLVVDVCAVDVASIRAHAIKLIPAYSNREKRVMLMKQPSFYLWAVPQPGRCSSWDKNASCLQR